MGEWKAQVTVRVRQTLRAEIEEFAAKEHRTMSNVSEVLLEWSIAHLKKAGTIDQLVWTVPGAEQSLGWQRDRPENNGKGGSHGPAKISDQSPNRTGALEANSKKWLSARTIPSAVWPHCSLNGAMNS
jgi:hypothetical protein